MKRKFSIVAGVVLALAASAAVSVARLDDNSHLAAAQDVLDAMNTRSTLEQTIKGMLDQQVGANPQIAAFRPQMTAFFEKYMSYDDLKGDLAKLYVDNFSEDELKQLADFYRSPTGKKLAEKLPLITVQSAAIGQQRVQAHLPELQDAIRKAAQAGQK